MKRTALIAVFVMGLGTSHVAAAACQLATIAEWQLRPNHSLPVVDGAINGQRVGVLLDTGAYMSFVRQSSATQLALRSAPQIAPSQNYGIMGASPVDGVYIDELRIGNAVRKDWIARVAGEQQLSEDVAVVLGYEFFTQLDIEFDLAHNVVRLFQAKGCDNASLAYWSKEALEVPLERGRRTQFTVAVNGRRLAAELDSGATTNILSMEGAVILGVTPETPGVSAGSCIGARGKDGVSSWVAKFESFAIGGEVIRNPTIRFADLWKRMVYSHTSSSLPQRIPGLPDILLGVDFLRTHRVYVAHSQDKLYFSYTGGTVFPARTGKPCNS